MVSILWRWNHEFYTENGVRNICKWVRIRTITTYFTFLTTFLPYRFTYFTFVITFVIRTCPRKLPNICLLFWNNLAIFPCEIRVRNWTSDLVFEDVIFSTVELVFDIRGVCWVYNFTKVFQLGLNWIISVIFFENGKLALFGQSCVRKKIEINPSAVKICHTLRMIYKKDIMVKMSS